MEPTQPQQIATWSSARDAWEQGGVSLFCGHSDVYSETWPTSGLMLAGTAYAQPTWAHRTDGSVSSSSQLLPTPSVADGMGGHLSRSGDRSHELLLPGVAKRLAGET